MRATAQERFDDKWTTIPETDCWWWIASINKDGYGQLKFKGLMQRAHRVSHILHVGDIPAGKHVLHHCDNPGCVNPDHLFLGTHQDNMDDKVSRGRQSKGEKHGTAKLTETQVLEIRAALGLHRDIAAKYGVSESRVSDIKRRKYWKCIS